MQYLRTEYAYKARKNEQNVRLRKEKCRCASECNKIEGFFTPIYELFSAFRFIRDQCFSGTMAQKNLR